MTAPTLSARALNRALLDRQLLLERAELPIDVALERVGGLQTQYAPSGYVGLWSRLRGFERAALTQALEERRVVQATLMRATIHMVSASDYWPMAIGTRRARQEWLYRSRRLEGLDLDGIVRCVTEQLASGPRRQVELQGSLAAAGFPDLAWSVVSQWVDLVRVPPSGTWERRRADLYGLATRWLGEPAVTEEEGLELLLRRYLAGFGPAPLADAANWAGVPATWLRPIANSILLVRYRDEQGRELLDLLDATLPDPETPAPIHFLPTWDATLLVHARRTQILPERYRPRIFDTTTPHSVPSFLIDGAVAGIWRWQAGRIELEPFEPLAPPARDALGVEAAALATFHE